MTADNFFAVRISASIIITPDDITLGTTVNSPYIPHTTMKTLKILLLLLIFAIPADAQQVNLLAMGDWGSNDSGQKEVAADISTYITKANHNFDAMLLAGDNFYVPLDDGIRDAKWNKMFESLYDPADFKFPFYVALGNHDYLADRFMLEFAYTQANPQSRWKMPARWYRVDLPKENPIVTVLVLDSNQPWLGDLGWAAELKWLKEQSEKPRTTKWLISVCHHPFVSNGDHGDNGVLQKAWGPLFDKAHEDFYICGHDHDVQHLEIPTFKQSFLLVGGGGAHTRPIRLDNRGPFSKQTHGFAHMTFTNTEATVRLVGPNGEILHAFTRSPEGKVNITVKGESDPATPRKVGDISRGGNDKDKTKD